MVIGMLGGSFCPPTKAHVELSNMCVEKGLCDKVIWVPVNEAYRKATNIAAKHRIEMVKLALMNEPNINYSLHEQAHDEIIRTLESAKELQEIYPNDKILFIAGADKLGFKWMQREEFVRDFARIAPLLVIATLFSLYSHNPLLHNSFIIFGSAKIFVLG